MIDSVEAQKIISQHRHGAMVVHNFTTRREWALVSTNLDLDLSGDEAMGKASSIGLGLALAQPARKVIILDGDGSLLMNLGSLVTIANMAPPNLIHFLFENGVYRTTGGQPIPSAGKVNFAGLAKEAGYAHVHVFNDPKRMERGIEAVFNQIGPTFVSLKIPPGMERPALPLPLDRIPRFMAAVQSVSRQPGEG